MKIFDSAGNELLELPESPITLDGYATQGGVVGFELDGHNVKVAACDSFEEARALLDVIAKAYIGGLEAFTIEGGDSP